MSLVHQFFWFPSGVMLLFFQEVVPLYTYKWIHHNSNVFIQLPASHELLVLYTVKTVSQFFKDK